MSLLPSAFPAIQFGDQDKIYNPAFYLFGNRLIKEQSVLEFATEFLAIAFADKKIGNGQLFKTPLPGYDDISTWEESHKLYYRVPVRLTVKLFALFGHSRLDGRHKVHERQFKIVVDRLQQKVDSHMYTSEQIVSFLEEFLSGFQGAGVNRAWCAQTFYPICPGLLTQETIWNETKAAQFPPYDWEEIVSQPGFTKYFSTTKRNFMARGGEVLYLQLCNLFATDTKEIDEFTSKLPLLREEKDLKNIYANLQDGLPRLGGEMTQALELLLDFIDDLDPDTKRNTNRQNAFLQAGWCPQESWQEGFLFAVELGRLLKGQIDPIERMELFITGCSLQVLRSLCAQSMRYTDATPAYPVLGYSWIVTEPEAETGYRQVAHRNLQAVENLIFSALRIPGLKEMAETGPRPNDKKWNYERNYNEADTRYGHQLFLSLGKKLGMIIPPTGPGARMIMNDRVLRYLVVVLIPPGEMCTYEDFLERLYIHYGIAIEGEQLANAILGSGLPANDALCTARGTWLADMLRAGGFLTELSDAWSIVHNPFALYQAVGRGE